MKKFILVSAIVFLHSTLQAKVICTNESLTYIDDVKSFGIPRIPVGTPMGSKSLVFRGQVVAQKDFSVTDANDWTNYQDWQYRLSLKNEKIVWQNPENIFERLVSAEFSFVDELGTEIISNENVNCLVSELPMP